MKKKLVSTIVAMAAVAALASCSSGGGGGNGGGGGSDNGSVSSSGEAVNISMVTHGVPGDAFWNVIRKGAEDAALDFNVKLNYVDLPQSQPDAGEQARLLESVLATNPQGLAVTIPDVSALGAPITQALDSDIPVVAFNSGASDYESIGVETYVGFAEDKTGQTAADALLERGADNVLCINQQQGNLLLERICAALIEQVEAAGGTADEFVVDGSNATATQADVKAALDRDPSINGLYALGPQVHDPIKAAIAEAGKGDDFVFGQLNLTGGIVNDVADGNIAFTIDLDAYLQGYLPVAFLAQSIRLGIHPVGFVNTGPRVLTQETAPLAVELSEKNIR